MNAGVASNSDVVGGALVYNWQDLEPTENNFVWTKVDNEIALMAAAGKVVSLTVQAGVQTPAWVYADGAVAFSLVWDKVWGFTPCSVEQMPLPWDVTFLAKWGSFVTALGARYDSNATVTHVKLTGINSETGEMSLPISVNQSINLSGQSCTGFDYITNWQNAGYTRTKALNAFGQIQGTFQTAFPSKPFAAMMQPFAFPPLDQNGAIIPGAAEDVLLGQEMVIHAVNAAGTQFVLQNDGLSANWAWPSVGIAANRINTGYQMIGVLGAQLPAAVSLGLAANPAFFEIYISDINNPFLTATISLAAAALP